MTQDANFSEKLASCKDMTHWYLGTMGFSYKQWLGPFYPAGMQARHYLAYYAQRFKALEMDSTFYGTPTEKTVRRWTAVTPPTFKICPKLPRQITHERRLHDATQPLTEFLTRMRLLGSKLGPIVVQFPPDFTFASFATLQQFMPLLPTDLRFAVEFRHRSWDRQETAVALQNHNLCWVATDYIHMPHKIVPTSDFLYLRFIGPHDQFATKDREMIDKTSVLQQWWQKIEPLLPQKNAVYGFFNNDYAGYSPQTVNKFKGIVGVERAEIRPLQQGRLL